MSLQEVSHPADNLHRVTCPKRPQRRLKAPVKGVSQQILTEDLILASAWTFGAKTGSGQISGDRAIVDLLIVLVTSEILQLAKASRGVSRWVSRFLMTFSCNEQAPRAFFLAPKQLLFYRKRCQGHQTKRMARPHPKNSH